MRGEEWKGIRMRWGDERSEVKRGVEGGGEERTDEGVKRGEEGHGREMSGIGEIVENR